MNPGFHNIVDGHGIGIMLTGMLIVFFGLSFISCAIIALARFSSQTKMPDVTLEGKHIAVEDEPTNEELLAVTTLVIYMESERSMGEWTQAVVPRQSRRGSIWASAGKMRSLSEGGSYA